MPLENEPEMKDAIAKAKHWVADILADETPMNVGLDEIEYDEEERAWKITIGFSRPWNTIQRNALTTIAGTQGTPRRSYRVVTVDRSGQVISMKRKQAGDD
jgi:hypothetical protein